MSVITEVLRVKRGHLRQFCCLQITRWCLRATFQSLGAIGTLLAIAFFGTLLWLATDQGLFPTDSVRAVSYIVLLVISGVMSAGVSWSHIRRRITGQLDVDDND